jgi:hypothetical protein
VDDGGLPPLKDAWAAILIADAASLIRQIILPGIGTA